MIQIVEVRVAMNTKSLNFQSVVWENDIPVEASENPTISWREVPWKKLEKHIFRLQKRIYRASMRGDVKTVRGLQKLLLKSWSAKCLAVRQVTQDNKGKKTAGVDGVKSLTPKQRLELIGNLRLKDKAKPVRRVWIPKPGKDEKRPLGIPVMFDRATQALVKMALEPEWEALFEPNSYGYRPGRSAHDAITAIFGSISKKPKYVLDADISNCFDRINHQKLLQKINTFPKLRRQIRAWLKSGVMDNLRFAKTTEGTPQGGVISPLLANIALHGIENHLMKFIDGVQMKYPSGKHIASRDKRRMLTMVRFADDFVVLHERLDIVLQCKEIISEWLKDLGLELKPSKTRIAHTLNEHEQEKPGFDFLGFNIRQYPTGKHHSGKKSGGELLGFTTRTKPSQNSVISYYRELAKTIDANKAANAATLISRLNPKIRGWTKYFSLASASEIFAKLDHLLFFKLWKWAKRRHPNKGSRWLVDKYWSRVGNNNWVFTGKIKGNHDKAHLLYHDDTQIITRYVKVKDARSPYDGDMVYWSSRLGRHPELPKRITYLLKKLEGKCNFCELHFKEEDMWEIDHIIPKSLGGHNGHHNLQLLHRHCHDIKTREDLTSIREFKSSQEKKKTWNKLLDWFNHQNWVWTDDIPTFSDDYEVCV